MKGIAGSYPVPGEHWGSCTLSKCPVRLRAVPFDHGSRRFDSIQYPATCDHRSVRLRAVPCGEKKSVAGSNPVAPTISAASQKVSTIGALRSSVRHSPQEHRGPGEQLGSSAPRHRSTAPTCAAIDRVLVVLLLWAVPHLWSIHLNTMMFIQPDLTYLVWAIAGLSAVMSIVRLSGLLVARSARAQL